MTPILEGTVSGFIFGGLAAASMLPMKFPDKKAALSAAFVDRFSIGLFVPLLKVSLASSPGWLIGLAVGLLLSLPSAIITKAYAPILIIGAVGGAVIGAVT
jgi:hypothetical protein